MTKTTVFKFVLALVIFVFAMAYLSMPRGVDMADSMAILKARWNATSEIEGHLQALHLTISDADMRTLEKARISAIKSGVLGPENKQYVQARMSDGDQKFDVKIRLKGMESDHWQGPLHWSFKVKTDQGPDGGTFSLMHPARRYGKVEAQFHHELLNAGAHSLGYDFVHLFINEVDYGEYAFEESFGGDLSCIPGIDPGVVLKLDFDAYISSGLYAKEDLKRSQNPGYEMDLDNDSLLRHLPIKVYRNPFQEQAYFDSISDVAAALFDDYRKERKPFKAVFDIELAMRAMNVMSSFNNLHPMVQHNLRFYYNPETERLELIPYDLEGKEEELKVPFPRFASALLKASQQP